MSAMDLCYGDGILSYALKNNCSRQVYDLLIKALPGSVEILFFSLIGKKISFDLF